mmetsp:Transcript_48007/g.80651  ORF Transcript_48007/g.80651 Transcript_48007/m.80651 type:complete len:94 (-) Transcript_48007:1286-1567(-)
MMRCNHLGTHSGAGSSPQSRPPSAPQSNCALVGYTDENVIGGLGLIGAPAPAPEGIYWQAAASATTGLAAGISTAGKMEAFRPWMAEATIPAQ